MGPFYCPADRGIYLDTAFFDELARRFAAPGDFAQAYVIAHEVGHHVQTLHRHRQTGSARAQSGGREGEANALQVRMELQADCYAGVWAARERERDGAGRPRGGHARRRRDRRRHAAARRQGAVVPESFTHGSAAQRQEALMRGYRGGTPAACASYTQGLSSLPATLPMHRRFRLSLE